MFLLNKCFNMRFFFFFLKRDLITHKLTYSKTVRSDIFGALLGVIVGSIVSYLSLCILGGCSVDLADLTIFCWYCVLLLCLLMLVSSQL